MRQLRRDAGRVDGVVTERGEVAASEVVLAGGAWSSLFLGRHGISIPQLSVRATALATGPLPQVFSSAAADNRMALRRRDDGGYTLAPSGFSESFLGPDVLRHARWYLPLAVTGAFDVHLRGPAPRGFPDAWNTPRHWSRDAPSPFERMRVLDPAPNRAKLSELRRRMAQLWAGIGAVPMQAAWAGMIDVMPDAVPVVDRVAAPPGLPIVTGTSGHGFGIGQAFGRIVADLAQGRETGHDLSRFRMSGFKDGSKLLVGPNI